MNDIHRRALEYVRNTGGNATVATFDDDHAPAGPQLRRDLMPTYFITFSGRLILTEIGEKALKTGCTP